MVIKLSIVWMPSMVIDGNKKKVMKKEPFWYQAVMVMKYYCGNKIK